MEPAKPRVAIPVPTSGDVPYNQRSWRQYAAAVASAGGDPVEVVLGIDERELSGILGECDGVCLPGSPADVSPERYGAARDAASAVADPAREATDFFLLDHALAHCKPVLGICYGLQSMNVWAGGTLVQDLHVLPVNHSAGSAVAVAHTVLVAQDSTLGSLLTPEEAAVQDNFLRLPVNTSHHQAVASPGDDFRIVARCPEDGVIEAIERVGGESSQTCWMTGVQWHPERSTEISAASRSLFRKLVQAAMDQTRSEAR
jgi:putative glutamine amidotransferase